MEKRAHVPPAPMPKRSAWRSVGTALICVAGLLGGLPAAAASLSPQELQILSHAVAFMQPPLAGGTLAVVYAAGDAASRQDADAIAAEIGKGLQAGNALLPVKVVDVATLANGGFAVAIAASGTTGPSLGAAVGATHVLCITADFAAVQSGLCTMGIISRPRIEIVLNHAAAAAADITFAAAFRMMIREM
jgi:hypothetical protein